MFYRSLRFVLLGCVMLCGGEALALAHEVNNQSWPVTKPFIKPLASPNSTFQVDLRLPHPKSTAPLSQDDLRRQPIPKTFRTRWLENYLTIRS